MYVCFSWGGIAYEFVFGFDFEFEFKDGASSPRRT